MSHVTSRSLFSNSPCVNSSSPLISPTRVVVQNLPRTFDLNTSHKAILLYLWFFNGIYASYIQNTIKIYMSIANYKSRSVRYSYIHAKIWYIYDYWYRISIYNAIITIRICTRWCFCQAILAYLIESGSIHWWPLYLQAAQAACHPFSPQA